VLDLSAEAIAVLQCADWQFAEAERSLRWAVALDPVDSSARHWLAMFPLVVSGRYEEALVQLRRAKQLDPLSLIINADIGGVYLMTRQFDRAVTQCTESLRLDPQTHSSVIWTSARASRPSSSGSSTPASVRSTRP
jgi:Flp pilus assembly protein TadD